MQIFEAECTRGGECRSVFLSEGGANGWRDNGGRNGG